MAARIASHDTKKGKRHRVIYRHPHTGKDKTYKDQNNKSTYKKKKDAIIVRNKLNVLLDTGHVPPSDNDKSNNYVLSTFGQVSEMVKEYWYKQLSAKQMVAPTYGQYIGLLNSVNETFGNQLIINITQDDIQDFLYKIAADISPRSANYRLFIIKQIFNKAVDIGALEKNFMTKIKRFSEKIHQRKHYQTPQIINDYLKACTTRRYPVNYYLPLVILLAVHHNGSKQEILSLETDHIDLERRGNDTYGWIHFTRTKNNVDRGQPITSKRVYDALMTWLDKRPYKESKYLFAVSRIDKPLTSFDDPWQAIKKITNTEDYHFHDLRRTYTSILQSVGANTHALDRMTGHQNSLQTARYNMIADKDMKLLQIQADNVLEGGTYSVHNPNIAEIIQQKIEDKSLIFQTFID